MKNINKLKDLLAKHILQINPLWFSLFTLGFGFLLVYNILNIGEQQFIYLAKSFLEGKLYLTQKPDTWNDASFFNNQYYWPSGPFPALSLLPFVSIFGLKFHQGYMHFFLNLINAYLLYKIALKITKSTSNSLWLTFAYIFSTSYFYVAIIPWSWFYAQILTTTLVLLCINEFLNKKRHFLIGVLIAFAFASRSNSIFVIFFFLGSIVISNAILFKKVKNSLYLLIPIFISILLLGFYNYFRFGSFLERGDSYAALYVDYLYANRSYGLWNIKHIPANIYFFLLKGPEAIFIPKTKVLTFPFIYPNPWGMSFIFTSPIYLFIFKAPFKNWVVRLSWVTSLIVLFFNLGWYSIGMRQYGYRYALDFYPFFYLLLIYGIGKKITLPIKILIVISFFVNLFMIPLVLSAPIN